MLVFGAAAAATLIGAAFLSLATHGDALPQGVAWGWLLTLLHGGAALCIDRRVIGMDAIRFLLLGLGLHLLRLALLITILFAAHQSGFASYGPFLATVLWGYVVFMSAEVWNLHVRTTRGMAPRTAAGG
jgi:hypothetical protein